MLCWLNIFDFVILFIKICFCAIADLDSFPAMARMGNAIMSPTSETEPPSRSRPFAGGSRGKRGAAESPHDTEVIFMLPLFQVHLNTLHLQGAMEPEEGGKAYWFIYPLCLSAHRYI